MILPEKPNRVFLHRLYYIMRESIRGGITTSGYGRKTSPELFFDMVVSSHYMIAPEKFRFDEPHYLKLEHNWINPWVISVNPAYGVSLRKNLHTFILPKKIPDLYPPDDIVFVEMRSYDLEMKKPRAYKLGIVFEWQGIKGKEWILYTRKGGAEIEPPPLFNVVFGGDGHYFYGEKTSIFNKAVERIGQVFYPQFGDLKQVKYIMSSILANWIIDLREGLKDVIKYEGEKLNKLLGRSEFKEIDALTERKKKLDREFTEVMAKLESIYRTKELSLDLMLEKKKLEKKFLDLHERIEKINKRIEELNKKIGHREVEDLIKTSEQFERALYKLRTKRSTLKRLGIDVKDEEELFYNVYREVAEAVALERLCEYHTNVTSILGEDWMERFAGAVKSYDELKSMYEVRTLQELQFKLPDLPKYDNLPDLKDYDKIELNDVIFRIDFIKMQEKQKIKYLDEKLGSFVLTAYKITRAIPELVWEVLPISEALKSLSEEEKALLLVIMLKTGRRIKSVNELKALIDEIKKLKLRGTKLVRYLRKKISDMISYGILKKTGADVVDINTALEYAQNTGLDIIDAFKELSEEEFDVKVRDWKSVLEDPRTLIYIIHELEGFQIKPEMWGIFPGWVRQNLKKRGYLGPVFEVAENFRHVQDFHDKQRPVEIGGKFAFYHYQDLKEIDTIWVEGASAIGIGGGAFVVNRVTGAGEERERSLVGIAEKLTIYLK